MTVLAGALSPATLTVACQGAIARCTTSALAKTAAIRPPARGHEPDRILEGEHVGDARGGELADRMSHDRRGAHSPARPELRERPLDGEERRLRVGGALEERGRLTRLEVASLARGHEVGVEDGEEGLRARGAAAGVGVVLRVEERRTAVHRRTEDGRRLVQLASHPDGLRPLPREEECDARCRRDAASAVYHGRPRLAAQPCAQVVACALDGRGLHGEPQRMLRAARVRAGAQLGERRVWRAQRLHVALGQCAQRLGGASREGEQARGARCHRARRDDGRLLDHEMRVGAAEAEGADAGEAPARAPRPRDRLGDDANGYPLPRDPRIGRGEVERARDALVTEREDDLEQPADPRRRLGVTDVRLERPDEERAVGGSADAHHGAERLDLDRVAERGPRAVRLDVVHVGWGDAGVGERAADDRLLREAVRDGEPRAATVLVHRAAADDGEHAVAVAHRVRQALEGDDGAALGADEAVGAGVEGLAAPVGRHHPPLREEGEGRVGEDDVDAAGEGEVALARAQRLAGEMDRGERRGAGGVDRHARALEPEDERQAPRRRVEGAAGGRVHVGLRGATDADDVLVLVGGDADEDAGERADQPVGGDAAVLERLPRDLEKEPLLRIHRRGLARGDAEELRIELVDLSEEAAERPRHALGAVRAQAETLTVARHLGHGVHAVVEEPPERLGRLDATRIAAPDADDGDRLAASLLARLELPLQPLDGRERLLDDGAVVGGVRRRDGAHGSSLAGGTARPGRRAARGGQDGPSTPTRMLGTTLLRRARKQERGQR
jgi:hypothetical protein